MVGLIRIADLDKDNLEDVFRVCSHNKLEDPLQREGMKLKRGWLIEMLEEYGPVTKIAYLDGRPVAQLLFYPEEAIPYIPHPREGVVRLICVYNPFPEVRGKGVGSALLKSLINACGEGLTNLRGRSCRFISALPFNTGEGTPMEGFYTRNGFRREGDELYIEINGAYEPPVKLEYAPLPEDRGKAVVFHGQECVLLPLLRQGKRTLTGDKGRPHRGDYRPVGPPRGVGQAGEPSDTGQRRPHHEFLDPERRVHTRGQGSTEDKLERPLAP